MAQRSKMLNEKEELLELAESLKKQTPCARFMSNVVEDVIDKKIDANVFVDQWPSFTTVISQEFSPCLSEVADIRIYTTEKENIEPLLTSADLLQNIGTWQLVHFVASKEEVEKLSSYLLETFKSHTSITGKECVVTFDYKLYEADLKRTEIPPDEILGPDETRRIKDGIFMKSVPKASAGFIAKHWSPGTLEYPLQYRVKYIETIISKFGIIGAYSTEDDRYPVSWCGRIPGAEIGLGYTLKEFRHRSLQAILRLNSVSLLSRLHFFVAISSSNSEPINAALIGYRCSIAIY